MRYDLPAILSVQYSEGPKPGECNGIYKGAQVETTWHESVSAAGPRAETAGSLNAIPQTLQTPTNQLFL